MKSFSLISALLLAGSVFSAGAATMTITSNAGVDVTANFGLGAANAAPTSSAFRFDAAKGLLGPSSSPASQLGFRNAAKDLFGITVVPATKSAFVHFFLTTSAGDLKLVGDVNRRVSKLLPQPWRNDALEFLRIETIRGRRVKLETMDFAHAPFQTHTFWVKVDGQGTIALAP